MSDFNHKLNMLRVTGKRHIVNYNNKDNTVKLTVQYKGQLPLRAMLITNDYESGVLLDYIQLVIFEKELTLKNFN